MKKISVQKFRKNYNIEDFNTSLRPEMNRDSQIKVTEICEFDLNRKDATFVWRYYTD